MAELSKLLREMGHSKVDNYIVPDVSSQLIGSDSGERGRVRIFDSSRDQDMFVTPHNHRFDLWCYVVQGEVENILYKTHYANLQKIQSSRADTYDVVQQRYNGEIGEYEEIRRNKDRYAKFSTKYTEGSQYFMRYDEIHSIKFGRGAMLLIIEGKPKRDSNQVLLPVDYQGNTINTLSNEDWMFRRE